MKILYRNGDILDSKADIILHQVNCMGVMGSGLAKQIALKYPAVYKEYRDVCMAAASPEELLGSVQYCTVSIGAQNNHIIANCFAQIRYGRDKRHTNYEALSKCLRSVTLLYPAGHIAIPYNIGCGLGGGNWNIVQNIIHDVFESDAFIGTCEIWKLY